MSPITYNNDIYIYTYKNDIIICYTRYSAHKKKAADLVRGRCIALYIQKSKQYSAHEQDLLPFSCGRCIACNMLYVIRETAHTRRRQQILFVGAVSLYTSKKTLDMGQHVIDSIQGVTRYLSKKQNRIRKKSLRTSASTQKRKPAGGFFIGIETVKTFFGSNFVTRGGGE